MVNIERTGKRDTFPSRVRRAFGNDGCYHSDVDMVETKYVNNNLVVTAVCEYKRLPGGKLSKHQQQLLFTFAKALECKALVIYYEEDVTDIMKSNLVIQETYPDQHSFSCSAADFQKYLQSL